MSDLADVSKGQKLISEIFRLIEKLGYGENIVRPVANGLFTLVVYNLKSDKIGESITYKVTFDPTNKNGLIFDKYLEGVIILLMGLNRVKSDRPDYRECVIEVALRDPKTMILEPKKFILNTNKSDRQVQYGVSWLDDTFYITINQALSLVEVLNASLGNE